MSGVFDAVVIGAGHNGLAAAATLARAGMRVLVVERAKTVGGMAKTVDWGTGAKGPEIAHLLYNLSPAVTSDLKLSLETCSLPTIALSPDGDHAVMDGASLTFAAGGMHPQAAEYAALHERLCRFAALLGQLSDKPPPSLAGGLASLRDIGGLARLGLGLKRMGKADMREFLRVILSNAYDLILDELPDGPVAGALAADAVRGAWAGPRSPGSVFTLLYRMGQGGGASLPIGGIGAVTDALARAATTAGAELRFGAGVASVEVEADTVRGVTLEDGTKIAAAVVLSSLAPLPSLHLAGAADFDVETTRRARKVRAKGTVAKLNLVLKSAPDIPGLTDAQTAGRLIVAPSGAYVESAFNPVKYGAVSKHPVIEAVIPSLTDPSLCDGGRQALSAIVQFVPHTPEGGWTDAGRAALTRRIIDTLATYMPGLPDLIEGETLLTPADIEHLTGAPGGHWHHAEMSIDQLLTVRPINGMARYAFGVSGLYLCGASAHPGGDVTGSPGRNAARRLLQERST